MLNGLLSRHRVGGGNAGLKQPSRPPGIVTVNGNSSETLSAYNLLKRTTPNVTHQAPTSIGKFYHHSQDGCSSEMTTNNLRSDYNDDIHERPALKPTTAVIAFVDDYSCDNSNSSTQKTLNFNSSYTIYNPGNKLSNQTAPVTQHNKTSSPPNYIRLNKLKIQQQQQKVRKLIATNVNKDITGHPTSHLEMTTSSANNNHSNNILRPQNRSKSLGSSTTFLLKQQQQPKPIFETTSQYTRSTRVPLSFTTKETEVPVAKKSSGLCKSK